MITTVSLAQAKQLCHVDELGDDRKSSSGEATGLVVSGAIEMYGSHTSRKSMLAQARAMSGTSPKRDEEKLVTP